jgi:UDP-4-amino-4,6-dideoxy-N-acetyl-beta-L-altrosamine N-acetyltransferase
MLLRPLDEAHLETVRQWRNAPHVRMWMAYGLEITPELHLAWWQKLDPNRNRYWIFSRAGQDMGMVHLKDIDWREQAAEAGAWTADPADMGSPWPVLAVLAMMEHAFGEMGLTSLRAKVRADHASILEFNRALGYQTVSEDGLEFAQMRVSADAFWSATLGLRNAAGRLHRGV